MPAAGQLVEHHAGLERVDRQQGRQGQRRARHAGHELEPQVADARPARGQHGQEPVAGDRQRADDQAVAAENPKRRVHQRKGAVGQQSGQNAQDDARHFSGEPGRAERHQCGGGSDRQRPPVPCHRCAQRAPPPQGFGQAEQARDLAADDDQPDPGEVAADHRVRDVLDQSADAEQTQRRLKQPGQQADDHQHQHDQIGRVATLHHLDGKRGEHRRRGRTGCADQALGATQQGCHQPQNHHPHDARQGAIGRVVRRDGAIDRDPEGHRGRKGNQHRRQGAPQITHRRPRPVRAAVTGTGDQIAQRHAGRPVSVPLRSCRPRVWPLSGNWCWAGPPGPGRRPPAACQRSSRSRRKRFRSARR